MIISKSKLNYVHKFSSIYHETTFSVVSFFFLRFYLFIHVKQRDWQKEGQREEKQAPCKEPDVGPNPRNLGSGPEPKADAEPLSHPDIPLIWIFPIAS